MDLLLRARNVPGDSEAERMNNAVRMLFSAPKEAFVKGRNEAQTGEGAEEANCETCHLSLRVGSARMPEIYNEGDQSPGQSVEDGVTCTDH